MSSNKDIYEIYTPNGIILDVEKKQIKFYYMMEELR